MSITQSYDDLGSTFGQIVKCCAAEISKSLHLYEVYDIYVRLQKDLEIMKLQWQITLAWDMALQILNYKEMG